MERTNYNGELRIQDEGKTVALVGWVAKKRNLGSLIFIDLRDRTGIVQLLLKEGEIEIPDIRNEYVISVKGIVHKKENPNKALKTGDIEVIVSEVKVISKSVTPPIIIDDNTDALEDTRLKYRYLDLRRSVIQEKLFIRHKITRSVREYLDNNGFIDVETPILNLSTPEGARDYLVPSRLHHGSFYALPQSPQLFKQLLMIGGFERYYQIARCFRDEDLRADRQPEFTQIDIETSFLDQGELLTLMEGLLYKVFKDVINYEIKLPLRQMEFKEAVNDYGSDKPDTRFGMKLIDVKDLMSKSSFEAFHNERMFIKAIVVNGIASETSRKIIDELQLEAKKYGLHGVTVIKYLNDEFEGSFTKFLSDELKSSLKEKLDLKNDDIVLVAGSENYHDVCFALGAFRNKYARKLGLIKPNTYDLLWVVHWPLFEREQETGNITSTHHPFTRPCDEDLKYLKEDPLKVYSYSYDIVINGYEAGGGSLRIYDQEVQHEIFRILGLTEEDIKRKFGFFVDAFKYGTPPHGGLAFGLDRLTMILSGTENIRDVIAFPKNLAATCPMSQAPQTVDKTQLDDLGIAVIDEEK